MVGITPAASLYIASDYLKNRRTSPEFNFMPETRTNFVFNQIYFEYFIYHAAQIKLIEMNYGFPRQAKKKKSKKLKQSCLKYRNILKEY